MIKVSCLGDVMCDNTMANNLDNYREKITGKYNFQQVFVNVKPLIEQSDFVLANLECPISSDNRNLTNVRWQFCSPYEFAEALKTCGVDYVSTANNHCLDRNIEGIENTISCLNKLDFYHSGLNSFGKRHKPLTVSVKGVKIGILAYTYGTNAVCNQNYLNLKNRLMVNLLQEQEDAMNRINPFKICEKRWPHMKLLKIIGLIERKIHSENVGKEWFEMVTFDRYRKYLINRDFRYLKKEKIDLCIAYLHVGGQYNHKPSKYTIKTVDYFWGKGCNMAICNHEHVIHGQEWRVTENKFATYALGNFLGSTGNEDAPFDRRSDYSIAVHAYIGKRSKKIEKITFSVLKTVLTPNGKYEVWPVFDLLPTLNDYQKEQVRHDCILAAKDFSGKDYSIVEKEFIL